MIMEKIKQVLDSNKTIKLMLLDQDNQYNKTGALEQIRLETGLSEEYIYKNYHKIYELCKQIIHST